MPDPESFEAWVSQAKRRKARTATEAEQFQIEHAGPEEVLVRGGGEEVWADGYRSSEAYLLEVKHVEKPELSPFIEGSRCGDDIRNVIREKERQQLRRYAAILKDPATPAVGLEILLNDARAAPFFEALMREFGVPGRIVAVPRSQP